MSHERTLLAGLACGAGAGAFWGLVFLAPELARDSGALYLTLGRYLCYGLVALALLVPAWPRLRGRVGRPEWIGLAWLGFTGNLLYYVLLSAAVHRAGIAVTSLVIAFLPAVLAIAGSRAAGAVPLRRLAPSLLLGTAGALCIGWQALGPATTPRLDRLLGLACAVGALASWSTYAVLNSRWLARRPDLSAHDWNLLTGVMTLLQSLLFVPVVALLQPVPENGAAWLKLAGVSLGLALLASMLGNASWNRASRLLPLTLVGQMILFETLFALLYGLAWERRLPTALELLALALVVASVLSCLAVHRRPAPELAPH